MVTSAKKHISRWKIMLKCNTEWISMFFHTHGGRRSTKWYQYETTRDTLIPTLTFNTHIIIIPIALTDIILLPNSKQLLRRYVWSLIEHHGPKNDQNRPTEAVSDQIHRSRSVPQTLRMKLNRPPRTQNRSNSSNRGRLGPDPQIPIGSSDVTYEA